MPDPMFTVPLSALVTVGVEPDTGRRYWWCGWMADDRPCQAEGHPVSREAAVAAAVQHLADVHGIVPAGEREVLRRIVELDDWFNSGDPTVIPPADAWSEAIERARDLCNNKEIST